MKLPFTKKEIKNDTTSSVEDPLLVALLGGSEIGRREVMTLPSVASNIDLISSLIASMPIKLYRIKSGKIEEVPNDYRLKLLNGNTGDTLNAYQIKQAMIEDYFLGKGGYCYIERKRNTIMSLRYVKEGNVSAYTNTEPIFKYVTLQVSGKQYKNFDFIKLLRNTKDGVTGQSIINQLSKLLETNYQTLLYQLFVVKSGGNKKGFLMSDRKLGQGEIDTLKTAWNKLYKTNEQNVIVLNNGLKFQESSNSSVEMQLNENTKTLASEIDNVFHIRPTFEETFKVAIFPIIKNFQDELNNVLLLESEKRNYFFEFDIKETIKANVKERYEAYELALKDGWKTINEIRQEENLNTIEGLDVVNVGLGSVLYDTKTQMYYTPNTNQTFEISEKQDDEDTLKEDKTTEEDEIKENNEEVVEENVDSKGGGKEVEE